VAPAMPGLVGREKVSTEPYSCEGQQINKLIQTGDLGVPHYSANSDQ